MALVKGYPFLRCQRIGYTLQALFHKSRWYCSEKRSKAVTASSGRAELDTEVKPLGEKVKETTKTASYMGVILLGVGVTGALFYAVFSELFSSKSPNNVYSKAMKRCLDDPRVQDNLGTPIKGFGEETRRGRRQHVSHVLYEKDGVKRLRMKFYLQGSRNKGTVQLEMAENSSGSYDYRFLFVDVDSGYSSRTIVLEDNRIEANRQYQFLD